MSVGWILLSKAGIWIHIMELFKVIYFSDREVRKMLHISKSKFGNETESVIKTDKYTTVDWKVSTWRTVRKKITITWKIQPGKEQMHPESAQDNSHVVGCVLHMVGTHCTLYVVFFSERQGTNPATKVMDCLTLFSKSCLICSKKYKSQIRHTVWTF